MKVLPSQNFHFRSVFSIIKQVVMNLLVQKSKTVAN